MFVGLNAECGQPMAMLNGKDLSGWKAQTENGKGLWVFGTAALDPADSNKLAVGGPGTDLISTNKAVNLWSDASFGDCQVELEFMLAKGSNSGVKMMKIYEIQLFDSYGKKSMDKQDCGAVYSETPPLVNACLKPGQWQSLFIDFHAPRFDQSGKKIANARFVKVMLNHKVVQEDVEIAHGTNVSRNAEEHPEAPILLQGDHGPVAFRNIKVTPVK
jgi:hypothetical protein